MSALRAALSRLEWITTPPTSYTNDTKVFFPPADDVSPQAEFKRSLLSRSMTVLDLGRSKLQGCSVQLPSIIKEDDHESIVSILENDPEQREFFELLHVASTAQLLIQDV